MNKNLIVSTYRLISVFLIIVGNPNMSAIGFQMHIKLSGLVAEIFTVYSKIIDVQSFIHNPRDIDVP